MYTYPTNSRFIKKKLKRNLNSWTEILDNQNVGFNCLKISQMYQ